MLFLGNLSKTSTAQTLQALLHLALLPRQWAWQTVTGQDLEGWDEVGRAARGAGDLNRCPSGLVSRDLVREAKARVGSVFKQNKGNRGPGESKIPTGTEIRVAGGNWGNLRLPHGLVVTAERQIARPTNPDQGSGRPFGPFRVCFVGPGA